MTCVHTCLLTHLCNLLDRLHSITIKRGDTAPDELGSVEFDARLITISRTATAGEFRATLAHEMVHLLRGPTYVDEEEAEERIVDEETARMLVPADALPAILEATNPVELAARFGVDVATAELGIELARRDRQESTEDVA